MIGLRGTHCDKANLHVLNGPMAGRIFHLPDVGTTIIGRDPDADFICRFEKISRRHCALEASPRGYILTDIASKNGTYVNQNPITSHELRSGDVIRIGELAMKFLQEEETLYSTPALGPEAEAEGSAREATVHNCEACGNDISLHLLREGRAKRIGSAILCASCVRRSEALNLQGVIAVEELRRLLGFSDPPETAEESADETQGLAPAEPGEEEAEQEERRRKSRRQSRIKRFR